MTIPEKALSDSNSKYFLMHWLCPCLEPGSVMCLTGRS